MDTIIQNLASDLINKRKFIGGNYPHMCAILDVNGTPLSYGYNGQYEHAEAMALRKLRERNRAYEVKRRIKVNILVVKTNGFNSKPCLKCVTDLSQAADIITIKNVYYTHQDEPTGLCKIKFSLLLNDPNPHVSSFYRAMLRAKGIIMENNTDNDLNESQLFRLSKIIGCKRVHASAKMAALKLADM